MKALTAGFTIAALAIGAQAKADPEPPPPLPPTPAPTTVQPPTQPGVPPPVPSEPLPRRHPDRYDEAGFVEVTMDSDEPGTYLQALTEHEGWVALRGRWHTHFVYARGLRWQPVCVAPCTMRVPPQLVYRVSGLRVTSSDEFTIGPPGGKTDLHVEAGSRGAHNGGVLSLVFGIPTAIIGVFLIAAEHDNHTAGYVTTGIGGGLIGLGAILLATSGTTVTDNGGRRVGIGPRGLLF